MAEEQALPSDDEDEFDVEKLKKFLGDSERSITVASSSEIVDPSNLALVPVSDTLAVQAPPGLQDESEGEFESSEEASSASADDTPSGLEGETEATIQVEHEDPTAPYLAATSWDELNLPTEILDGIFEMGFVKPSKIQEWALPIALQGGNIIGQARNGSGKTAAFALAMLMRIDKAERRPQGLCVCPTRELATQNHDVIAKLGKFMDLNFFLAVPGIRRPPRVDAQVVVGTPGKVQDLMRQFVLDGRDVRVFVMDEADVMLDESNTMGTQVVQIKKMLPLHLQVLLFSATWPDRVDFFARTMVPRANRIMVQKQELTLDTIMQTFIHVGEDSRLKFKTLCDLYGALNIGQSIIFVNSRESGFTLAKKMKAEGHSVTLICGTQRDSNSVEKIDEAQRDRIMVEFRTGITKVLIATNVLARGIDVPAVTLVVNYEVPTVYGGRGSPCYETYMHRIGRTGRFGLKGIAVNLVTTREKPMLESLEEFYKCTIKQLNGDCEEMEQLLRNCRLF